MDRKRDSKKYYDKHHGNILAMIGYWKHDYRYTVHVVENRKKGKLMDIGCGTGAFLEYVSKRVPELKLYGMDLSDGMVQEAGDRMTGRATICQGDSENMPLEDNQFDIVTCNMSIHHYPHAQIAVNEMYRILNTGGILCINDMDCITPIRVIANIVFPHLKSGDVKMYSRKEIEVMVKEAGFRRVKYKKISPFSFLCIAQK